MTEGRRTLRGRAAGTSVRRGWRSASLSTVLGTLARPVRTPRQLVPGLSADGASSSRAKSAMHDAADDRDASAPHDAADDRDASAPQGASTASGADRQSAAARPLPVVLGGARARQVDPTTCGSAVLLMLAATGDPVLARWLEGGTLPDDLPPHRVPPEIPPGVVAADAAGRLAAAQRHIKSRTGPGALGPVGWPAALGTPPWTAAREARFPGVRYRSVPMHDGGAKGAALLTSVHGATTAGVPVPLYTGGDLGRGVTTAVPRHVVLAVPPPAGAQRRGHDGAGNPVLHIFDPSAALVHQVPVAELLDRREPHPALGGWTHVCWVLLPVPA